MVQFETIKTRCYMVLSKRDLKAMAKNITEKGLNRTFVFELELNNVIENGKLKDIQAQPDFYKIYLRAKVNGFKQIGA